MSVTEDILFSYSDIEVVVNRSVYDIWLNNRQTRSQNTEQFGVLIGSHSIDQSTIWIDLCTSPKTKDISQRTRFVMKDPFHQKAIDEAFINTDGEMGYIGTWHTHPQNKPIPSSIDLEDWSKCELRNPDRKLLFVIIGNQQINIYINLNNKLEVAWRNISNE